MELMLPRLRTALHEQRAAVVPSGDALPVLASAQVFGRCRVRYVTLAQVCLWGVLQVATTRDTK
jgi:hypothetical protein